MKNDKWWQPDILAQDEIFFRENINEANLDLRNDFGSYRKVLKTKKIKGSMLNSHNDLNPKIKINAIDKIFGPFYPQAILDAGCGMGYTSIALQKKYSSSKVLGVDISLDAIEYAKLTHRGPDFIQAPISPKLDSIGRFDLIYCFEFYPFTRNIDIDFQKKLITWFMQQLNPLGKLIVWQKWDNPNSLSTILNEICMLLPDFKFKLNIIPHPKLLNVFPINIAKIMNKFFEFILRRKLSKTVLIVVNDGSNREVFNIK